MKAKYLSLLLILLISTSVNASILDTRHNLSTGGKFNNMLNRSDTDEVCVFCHTPHSSNTNIAAPLWNKGVAKEMPSYTLYSSGTMQGQSKLTITSASIACLSCHDGTQAMDNMINQPGSSGYTPGGANRGDMGSINNMSNGIVTNLGTDLSNDHPVGIPYCGGGQTSPGAKSGCKDQDFFPAVDNGSGNGFMVSAGSGATLRENMRLYGTEIGSVTVECGSCHDPHISTTKTFLRVSNTGSRVCLTCHAK